MLPDNDLLPMFFCLVGFFWVFYCIAQRFCKTERPLFSFAPADRMIALIFFVPVCPLPALLPDTAAVLFKCPSELLQKLSGVYVLV